MPNTMTTDHIAAVGKKLVAKYQAVHHNQADFVDFSLGQVLAVYGMLRLSELSIGIEGYGAVDKKLAGMLTSGPLTPLPYAHHRMGGLAGAYRFYQGGYKVGDRATCLAYVTARSLADQPPKDDQETAERLLAVAPFLAMSAAPLHAPDLHDSAVSRWQRASDALLDGAGLFRSAPDGSVDPSYWCRANGYAVAALADILRHMPHNHSARPRLIVALRDVLDRLLALQTPAGLWRNVLTDDNSYEETSGSALIAYALFTALSEGGIAASSYAEPAQRAWDGLLRYVNLAGNGNVTHVCPPLAPGAGASEIAAAPPLLNALDGFGPLMLAAAAAYAWQRQRQWSSLTLPAQSFARPDSAAIEAYIQRLHETCETACHGDGSWGPGTAQDPPGTFDTLIKESQTSHPLARSAAHCVMGYLAADRYRPNALYRRRAGEGLEWLLREQEPDGSFRLWTRRDGGQVRHNGCLFETGIAASALLMGYEYVGDQRYLAASERAAHWAMRWPVDMNVNFNAFVIWHMADHYRLTGDATVLDAAIYKTRQAMIAPQQPQGGWVGHNSWTWYHGISLRAYAALYEALPQGHPFAPILAAAMDAAVCYLAALQADNGSVHPNPEHTDLAAQPMSHQITALVRACAARGDASTRCVLDGLVAYRISPDSGDPDRVYNNEQKVQNTGSAPDYLFALGAYLSLDVPKKRE